jgi:hypothetical protein
MKNATTCNRRRFLPSKEGMWSGLALLALSAAVCFVSMAAGPAGQDLHAGDTARLEETRLAMGKWIETQQILSRERKEWQQGKEILLGRLELIQQEIATLEEKIAQAKSDVVEVDKKRDELNAEYERLEATNADLSAKVGGMEAEVRRLIQAVPEPIRARVQQLIQRLPADSENTDISVPERFQNVIGFLNELNKANNEITVSYEVHELEGGRLAEVQALYVGLAQAYYVSASGEAGIGRPTLEGWQWEPSASIAGDVLKALEILQGKHSPAFVPLPVRVQ